MSDTIKNHLRLSDRILEALELSLDQQDLDISELLSRALEMSMTRNAGGPGFVERRSFTDEVDQALTRLDRLKKEIKGSGRSAY